MVRKTDFDALAAEYADLFRLWPNAGGEHLVPDEAEDAVRPAPPGDSLGAQIEEAVGWHDQPLPEIAELRRLIELIAGFELSVWQGIQFRGEQERLPADVIGRMCAQAPKNAARAVLSWFRQARLAAFLETIKGLEVLPYGTYWQDAEGSATPLAREAFGKGTGWSCRHPGLVGKVMVRKTDFDALAAEYMSDRTFAVEEPGATRFTHPVWDLRDVFGWVLDRDSARFGRINSETDWKSAAWAARFYTDMPRTEFDRHADQTLLHALQCGDLTGYQGTLPFAQQFWIDKTELTLRYCAASFYREEVLALWPDPRTLISRAPPPITPLRGGYAPALVEREPNVDRSPQWTIWKNMPELRVFEAVALSLNIDPRKVRHNPHAWMAGKRLFYEDQEFNDRFLVAERNLADIGVLNSVAAHYKGQEPIIRLDSFVRWALRIGWPLPAELLGNRASQEPDLPPAPLDRINSEAPTEPEQKTQRILNSTKRDAVKDFVAKHYPDGIPPGVTRKHIARQVEAEMKVSVDERTVGRALGRR
jgi:hypothetical protein